MQNWTFQKVLALSVAAISRMNKIVTKWLTEKSNQWKLSRNFLIWKENQYFLYGWSPALLSSSSVPPPQGRIFLLLRPKSRGNSFRFWGIWGRVFHRKLYKANCWKTFPWLSVHKNSKRSKSLVKKEIFYKQPECFWSFFSLSILDYSQFL